MADIDDLLAEVEAGPQGPEVGAFFDFDGTLIDGYSAALYFRERLTSGEVGLGELAGTLIEVFNMQQRGHDVTRLVQVALGALAGTEVAAIEALGQELWRTKIAGKVYPDARRLVRAHLRAGHTVALASSATRFQAAGAAADLDIEHLLVTEIEDDGRGAHRPGPRVRSCGASARRTPSGRSRPSRASTWPSPTPTATAVRTSSTSRPSVGRGRSTPTAS